MKPDHIQPLSHSKQATSLSVQQSPLSHYPTLKEQLSQIYKKFFTSANDPNIPPFQQIDHGPKQLCQQLFSIQQNCLLISYQAFENYYQHLFKILQHQQQIQESLMAANLLLSMNGQNDRAWNLKKKHLLLESSFKTINSNKGYLSQQKQTETQKQYLNISWQLVFNAAVCLKCKKSSSYYQYRLRLIEIELDQLLNQQLDQQKLREKVHQILQRQNKLINRVLARFFRNYFCWMFRVKLVKLINQKLVLILELQQPVQQSPIEQAIILQNPINPQQTSNSIIQSILHQQLANLHKFLQKYCNDYSGYSYLISYLQRYLLKQNNNNSNSPSTKELIKQQLQWIKELNDYCQVAYDSQQHYKHLIMYSNHVLNLDKQLLAQKDN